MIFSDNIINTIYILLFLISILLSVAFITWGERKTMAILQRRLGPNLVGYYGILQPYADALKLLIKEYIIPIQANIILFFLGPIITLIFSLLGYVIIPFGPGIAITNFSLGILYILSVSSLATYGILLAGWSANSKYAFLGSLRSTAQLISYELIISSVLLIIVLLTASFNLTVIIEIQRSTWFVFLLLPLFMIFFIACVAETNRAPFDLAEAESELVSGYMTEHAASIFVFFFLAEYASIILMCILIPILFFGGYETLTYICLFIEYSNNFIISIIYYIWICFEFCYIYLTYLINCLDFYSYNTITNNYYYIFYYNLFNFYSHIPCDYFYLLYGYTNLNFLPYYVNNNLLLSYIYSFSLSFKSQILIFLFILVRASFPRLRFDKLMSYCWTNLLPILIGIIIIIPSILYIFNILLCNMYII